MTTFYRAKLVLFEVTPDVDGDQQPIERHAEVAAFDVTAGSPGSAMRQAAEHSRVLADFHADAAARIGRDRTDCCPACGSLGRSTPRNLCKHMWHQPTIDLRVMP